VVNHGEPISPRDGYQADLDLWDGRNPAFDELNEATRKHYAQMLAKEAKAAKPKKRKGEYDEKDVPLTEEMRVLIMSGKAKSANAAAGMVAKKAVGYGTLQSRVDRLRRLYGERYPKSSK
jgi:hypothetical protein